MDQLKRFIAQVAGGASLTESEAREAFETIMSGGATPAQIGGFLMALRMRGESVEEITGAARIMREKAAPVAAPEGAIDTCGTGGDAKGTHNISTCTAFVVAGCGVPVAKHGNRALSSKSGSADVLEALGVNLNVTADTVARCIAEAGLGFMFAPAHHSAMRHVGPTRQELGTRTLFNLLGPLSNPAGARYQVVGVFDRRWIEPLARVLGNLGSARVWVVHGADGLDELTTTGPTAVAELKDGRVHAFEVTPDDAGLPQTDLSALIGGDAATNAAAIADVLGGAAGPLRDIVLLNAAAALVVAGRAAGLREGVAVAGRAIDKGHARAALDRLIEITKAEAA